MPSMRLAIDASGGDFAPDEIIAGALASARQYPSELALVGRAEQIEEHLQKFDVRELSIEIVDAPETIEMGEDPALAVRKKRNASIVVACELVHDGHADAVISMGHTGAGMVAALLTFGRLPGIDRPAAIAPYLGFAGTYLLDVGLNTEVQPQNLLQFAIMGSVYAEKVGGIARPRVALLANGTEPRKGNAIGKQAYELLTHSSLNFIGNVEGLDLPRGTANVVVSDGFSMNVTLKVSEGLIAEMLQQIAAEVGTDDARTTAALARLRDRHDYARVGAAPLLGVNGLIFIGHGRSKAPAVISAIEAARRAVENRLLDALREGLNTA